MNAPARKTRVIGAMLRPGHTPGGFTEPFPMSSGEHNQRDPRHYPKRDHALDAHRYVIEAANRLLGSTRFGR